MKIDMQELQELKKLRFKQLKNSFCEQVNEANKQHSM